MILRDCAFETRRLLVKECHSLSPGDWWQEDLAKVVAAMLTEVVTRSLPPSWQGIYSIDRALQWIEEQDREGTPLLVVDTLTHQAVGLMMLFETQAEEGNAQVDIRLGYLLSEAVWGMASPRNS